MNTFSPLDERILIHGRTVKKEPLPLFWTASGIELETDASELWIEVESTGYTGLLWLRAELDGATVLRQAVSHGVSRICVYAGAPRQRRRVQIFREQQPFPRDPDCVLYIRSIECDRELFPAPPRKRKIEFVGDSVTAGEGLCGPASLLSGGPIVYSSQNNYALLTGRALDADVDLIALSGWGAAVSWDNNPRNFTMRIYRQVCGAIPDPDGQKLWDFDARRPDAVVFHLGNNDFFALDSPPYRDPETGAVTKFRLEETISRYAAERHDGNVSYLPLPPVRPENAGSNGHPGPLDHRAAAEALTEHLRRALKI